MKKGLRPGADSVSILLLACIDDLMKKGLRRRPFGPDLSYRACIDDLMKKGLRLVDYHNVDFSCPLVLMT